MEETLKYIEVLNWGYGGFAPMTISQDFEYSYKQVAERLQLLDGLNWGRLLNEAKDKSSLQKRISIDTDFYHQLHFMRDRQMLLDAIPTMFKAFHNEADKLCNNGNWTNEQWQEYRGTLGAIESIFAKRLKDFATAYSDIIGDEQEKPIPTRGRSRQKKTFKDKMIDDADGVKLAKIHKVMAGRKGKDAALIILACMDKGWVLKPTYKQVVDEFGDIGHKSGFNRYLSRLKFTDEEISGAKKALNEHLSTALKVVLGSL